MNHEVQLLDRHHWRYWLDGNGAWMNRWECTSHDLFLFILMTAGIVWMVAEYFWYAWLVRNSRHLFSDVTYRTHLDRLMKVFLFCGSIHFFNVILWFWTPHILWCVCYFANALLTNSLNRWFRRAIMSKHLSDSLAESRLKEIGSRLDHIVLGDIEPPQKTLRELAEELRRMI